MDNKLAFEISDGWRQRVKEHCDNLDIIKTPINKYHIESVQMDMKDMLFVIDNLLKEKVNHWAYIKEQSR